MSDGPSDWSPSPDLMTRLTEMGISASMARSALYNTGNSSVEVAIAWIFENGDHAVGPEAGAGDGAMSSAGK